MVALKFSIGIIIIPKIYSVEIIHYHIHYIVVIILRVRLLLYV